MCNGRGGEKEKGPGAKKPPSRREKYISLISYWKTGLPPRGIG